MPMKKIFLFALTGLLSAASFAQSTTVPAGYKLETPADYSKYEKDVIATINWLQGTAPGGSDRKAEASRFLMDWMAGSQELEITVEENIVNFQESNPELLLIFMGGWAKYSLETRKFSDELNGNIRGIESVIDYYQRNKDLLKKDARIEAYTELQRQKKLAAYIKNKMHKH